LEQKANNRILKSKKQTTKFIVINNFIGTKTLADIFAKLALTEIGNTEPQRKKLI